LCPWLPFPLIPRLEALQEKYGVLLPCYGHAGDGNLHVTVVNNPEAGGAGWKAVLPLVLTDLYREVKLLGGTISGEHGIGHKRKKYLNLVLSDDEIRAMQKIKLALDPLNILNPGKIFDLTPESGGGA
jgi:glycolate oxidase